MGNQQSIPSTKDNLEQQADIAKIKADKDKAQDQASVQAYNELLDTITEQKRKEEITKQRNMLLSAIVAIVSSCVITIIIGMYFYTSTKKTDTGTSVTETSNISTSDIKQ